jgi:hypothetical protein
MFLPIRRCESKDVRAIGGISSDTDSSPSLLRSTPVLLAVDEAQALFMRSNYRSPQFDLLESYALSLPRLLLDYVSGRKSFNKGAILTAISLSTPQHAPSREVYAALPQLANASVVTPYDKVDVHHVEAAKGLEVFDVGDRLDLQEARGILDLCQHRKFVFGGESEAGQVGHKAAKSGANDLAPFLSQ